MVGRQHWPRTARLREGARIAGTLPVLLALLLLSADPAAAAGLTLAWDASPEADVAGYRLHYGFSSRRYTSHVDVGATTIRTVRGLDPARTHYFAVTAYDTSGNESRYSNEVAARPEADAPEMISAPAAPSGPAGGTAGTVYAFDSGGAHSSLGHTVQYRFFWSDGTTSGWLPAGTTSASTSWESPGAYTALRVQARCAAHPSVTSPASPHSAITIAAAPVETVSSPSVPLGPASVSAGAFTTYGTGGALSSDGHPVQYRFSWADGTSSGWLPVGTTAAAKSWSSPGLYSAVRAEARCAEHPAVVSPASPPHSVVVAGSSGETISPPGAPYGPAEGPTWTAISFTADGAASALGDPVAHRFHWGDGTVSGWISGSAASAWKSWEAPGTYRVQVEAACSLHPSAFSVSPPVEIAIGARDPLLFSEDFADGAGWVSRWSDRSGHWSVGGPLLSLGSGSLSETNRIVAPAVGELAAGRITARIALTRSFSRTPNAGLVFAYRDPSLYRYVAFQGRRVIIGQVGDTPEEAGGVKASEPRRFPLGAWRRARVDVHPDGTVRAFLGASPSSAASYRFRDLQPGRAGLVSGRARALFDDFAVWDGSVLEEER